MPRKRVYKDSAERLREWRKRQKEKEAVEFKELERLVAENNIIQLNNEPQDRDSPKGYTSSQGPTAEIDRVSTKDRSMGIKALTYKDGRVAWVCPICGKENLVIGLATEWQSCRGMEGISSGQVLLCLYQFRLTKDNKVEYSARKVLPY